MPVDARQGGADGSECHTNSGGCAVWLSKRLSARGARTEKRWVEGAATAAKIAVYMGIYDLTIPGCPVMIRLATLYCPPGRADVMRQTLELAVQAADGGVAMAWLGDFNVVLAHIRDTHGPKTDMMLDIDRDRSRAGARGACEEILGDTSEGGRGLCPFYIMNALQELGTGTHDTIRARGGIRDLTLLSKTMREYYVLTAPLRPALDEAFGIRIKTEHVMVSHGSQCPLQLSSTTDGTHWSSLRHIGV